MLADSDAIRALGSACSGAPSPESVDAGEDVVQGIADQAPPVLVGAGDIASCGSSGDEATAALPPGLAVSVESPTETGEVTRR